MRFCIYCLERKPADAFNREHVIPQAFGSFADNMVLDCVCTDCNTYFGKNIELKVGRDSIEGLDRYWSGFEPTKEYKSFGRRSTTIVEFQEGIMKGAKGYFAPNPDGGELLILPFPSLGFAQPQLNEGAPLWFRVDEVPDKEDLVRFGFDLKVDVDVHCPSMPWGDAVEVLRSKGFKNISEPTEVPSPQGRIYLQTIGTVGRIEMRAATKIALNYLAKIEGLGLVRCPQFSETRQFARFDHGPCRVLPSRNPWDVIRNGRRARGHYVAVETLPSGQIVAQVSLMLRLRYVVPLTMYRFATFLPQVSSAHFFDLDDHTLTPTRVPLITRPKIDARAQELGHVS